MRATSISEVRFPWFATGIVLATLILVLLGYGCNGTDLAARPSDEILTVDSGTETLTHPELLAPKLVVCEGDCPPALLDAIDFWNGQTGVEVFSFEGDGLQVVDVRVAPVSGKRLGDVFPGDPCGLTIDPAYVDFLPIWIHELGHCLGFGHSKDERSIMYWSTAPGQHMTSEIIDAVAEAF